MRAGQVVSVLVYRAACHLSQCTFSPIWCNFSFNVDVCAVSELEASVMLLDLPLIKAELTLLSHFDVASCSFAKLI